MRSSSAAGIPSPSSETRITASLAFRGHFHENLAAAAPVLPGIVEKVREDLLDAQRIDAGRGVLAAHGDLERARGGAFAELAAELAEKVAHVDGLALQHQLARLDAAQFREVARTSRSMRLSWRSMISRSCCSS